MRKMLFVVVILLAVSPSFAVLASLGPWMEGDPGTTHQFWDFTPNYVTAIPGDGYSAIPETVISPAPSQVVAGISPGSTYDGVTQFVSQTYIAVSLEIPNYDILNPYKEIWVDVGTNVEIDPVNINVQATPTDLKPPFDIVIVPGQGDADFGVMIWPNPYVEKINFVLLADPTGAPVILDYIHVDTICVPEPATLALLGIGGLTLIRRKK